MPPGFDQLKPSELPNDPIDEFPDKEKQPMRTNTAGTTHLSRTLAERKHLPQYAPADAQSIPLPQNPSRDMHRKPRNAVLAGPHQPTNSLHNTTHAPNTAQRRKRGAAVAGLKHDPWRQYQPQMQQMSRFDDEEDDINVTTHSNSRRTVKRKPKFSEWGFESKRPRSETVQLSDNEAEAESPHPQPAHLDPYDSLNEVVQEVNKTAPQPSQTDSRWSGNGGNGQSIGPTRWTNSKRPLLSANQRKWDIVSFMRGEHHLSPKTPPAAFYMCAPKKGSREPCFQIFKDNAEVPGIRFSSEKLYCVKYCHESKTFGTQLRHSHSPRSTGDEFILFTLKNTKDVNEVVNTFRDFGCIPVEKDRSFSETFVKNINEWNKKSTESLLSRKDQTEADEQLARECQDDERRKSTRNRTMYGKQTRKAQLQSAAPFAPRRITRNQKGDGAEGPETRAIKRSRVTPPEMGTPTAKMPKLSLPSRWNRPLLFPFEGPKRTNVDWDDLNRLNEEEFLNDNLMNFYMRYIEEHLRENNPTLAQETHFFNTFFYERLTMKGDKKRNLAGVLKWTAKIDLFKKNYVIVPINESSHWYLAIICNLQHLERKLQKPAEERVVTGSDATVTGTPKVNGKPTSQIPPTLPSLVTGADAIPVTMSDMTREHSVSGAQEGLEKVSITEAGPDDDPDEWPAEDENERLDDKIEEKNKRPTLLQGRDSVAVDVSNNEETSSKPGGKERSSIKSKSQQKGRFCYPPDTPAIIILDSMSTGGPKRPQAVKNLKDWLILEARTKRGLEIERDDVKGTNYAKAPNQTNWYDCGLYVLHYIEVFLGHAQEFVTSFLAKDNAPDETDLWRKDEIQALRKKLFKLILDLHDAYEVFEVGRAKDEAASKPKSKPAFEANPEPKQISEVECKPVGEVEEQTIRQSEPGIEASDDKTTPVNEVERSPSRRARSPEVVIEMPRKPSNSSPWSKPTSPGPSTLPIDNSSPEIQQAITPRSPSPRRKTRLTRVATGDEEAHETTQEVTEVPGCLTINWSEHITSPATRRSPSMEI